MGEDTAAVLARLDANVANLITQIAEIKAEQREKVSRERLEIEVRSREADSLRLQADRTRFENESKEDRRKLGDRVDALEDALNVAQGGLRVLGALWVVATIIIGVLVGHLYFH